MPTTQHSLAQELRGLADAVEDLNHNLDTFETQRILQSINSMRRTLEKLEYSAKSQLKALHEDMRSDLDDVKRECDSIKEDIEDVSKRTTMSSNMGMLLTVFYMLCLY